MSSIGGVSCTSFVGVIKPPMRTGRQVVRPGIADIGHVAGARVPVASDVITQHIVTGSDIAIRESIADLPYSGPVDVTDGKGDVWPNCIVESALVVESRACIDNGVDSIILTVEWIITAPDEPNPPPPEP